MKRRYRNCEREEMRFTKEYYELVKKEADEWAKRLYWKHFNLTIKYSWLVPLEAFLFFIVPLAVLFAAGMYLGEKMQ